MKRRQELPIVSGILVAANVIVYLICTLRAICYII